MVSPSYFPAIAAVELGYFGKEGLEATIELLFPVTKTYEALRDGRLDFVSGAAHAALYAFRDWAGCKLLCALSQNMYWFLVVRRDLGIGRGDLRALKGLRMGAARGRRGADRAGVRSFARRRRGEKACPGGAARAHPRARSARRALLRPEDFRGNGRIPRHLCASDRAAVGGAGLRPSRRDAVRNAVERGLLAAARLLVGAGGIA